MKLYLKQLQMVSTLLISRTTVVKQHSMGNCFHTILWILKNIQQKGYETNQQRGLLLLSANKTAIKK
jgi:hypothetical protein